MTDKLLHYIAGFLIAGIISLGTGDLVYGLIAGVTAGFFKEIIDYFRYGGGDFFDFFATALGAVSIIPVWELLIKPFI